MGLGSYYETATPLCLRDRWIPSGSYAVDALCGRGWSRSSVIHLFGPSQSRKSTLSIIAMAAAQQAGCAVGLFDTEGGFLEHVALISGLDFTPPEFHLPPTHYGSLHGYPRESKTKVQRMTAPGFMLDMELEAVEDVFRNARAFFTIARRGGILPFGVIDSMSRLSNKEELKKGEAGNIHMQAAKIVRQCFRVFLGSLKRSSGVLIVVDHQKPTGGAGQGSATEFFSTTRLSMNLISEIQRDGQDVGFTSEVTAVKSRYAAKMKAPLTFYYDSGIDRCSDVLWTAQHFGILIDGGSGMYDMPTLPGKGKKKFRGISNWPEFYKDNVEGRMPWWEGQLDNAYELRWRAWCATGNLNPEHVLAQFSDAEARRAAALENMPEEDLDEEIAK